MKKIFNLWLYELGKSKFMLGFLMIVFFVIQVLVHLIRILRIDPKNINVEWGGNWKMKDTPHFELK